MEKRQKDISQNRWLPLLRGRSHKGSSVETGVCLDFPRPGGPLGKGYPLGGRENKKTSIKTGVCPDCPVGKRNALRGRSHKGTSVKTGFSPPASPKGSLRIQTGSHDQTRYLQTLCPEIPNRQRKKNRGYQKPNELPSEAASGELKQTKKNREDQRPNRLPSEAVSGELK